MAAEPLFIDVMKEFRLTDALATDNHFRIAGFNPLLAD